MAGMQRFVTYIYAYENGQKNSNAGYAKIETRGNNGRMDIHFSSDGWLSGVGKVSFLYIESGKLVFIPQGEFCIENGRGVGQFLFQTENLSGMDLGFQKIDGIYITDRDNRMYLSFWKDVERSEFREMDFVEYGTDMLSPEQVVETEPPITESARKEMIEDAEQESLHTMEIPMRNVFPSYTMEDIWRNMEKSRSCVQINKDMCAIQIELSDLRELPKKYWYLGNNSFLLHGFFNYRHLLFGRMPDGKWFLGVPGTYEPQERVIASVFGFPGFAPISEGGEANEKQPVIWYHILVD